MNKITEIHINKSAKRISVVGEVDGEIKHVNLAINDDEFVTLSEKHQELFSELEETMLNEIGE